MSGYCSVDDVCKAFPQFQRNANGSIQDTDIQGWIDDRKARIRSALLSRGFDPDNPPVQGDAANFLRALNRDSGIADLGDALQGTATLQPGEYSLPALRRRTYEAVMKEILDGEHDSLFQPLKAATADVGSILSGIAGAERDTYSTPRSRGENRSFGRNQDF